MSNVIRVGADAGNSALKLMVEGLEDPIYIPSVYTEAVNYGFDMMDALDATTSENILDHLDVSITTTAFKTEKRLIIGEKVVLDGLEADYPPIDANKAYEEFPVILILTGLAVASVKLNPGKSSVKINYEGTIA